MKAYKVSSGMVKSKEQERRGMGDCISWNIKSQSSYSGNVDWAYLYLHLVCLAQGQRVFALRGQSLSRRFRDLTNTSLITSAFPPSSLALVVTE